MILTRRNTIWFYFDWFCPHLDGLTMNGYMVEIGSFVNPIWNVWGMIVLAFNLIFILTYWNNVWFWYFGIISFDLFHVGYYNMGMIQEWLFPLHFKSCALGFTMTTVHGYTLSCFDAQNHINKTISDAMMYIFIDILDLVVVCAIRYMSLRSKCFASF